MSKKYKDFIKDKYEIGEFIPWWKGYVRDCYITRSRVVAPVPFNLLFGLLWFFWWKLKRAFINVKSFQKLNESQIEIEIPDQATIVRMFYFNGKAYKPKKELSFKAGEDIVINLEKDFEEVKIV